MTEHDPPSSEAERVDRVYEGYRADPGVRTRWAEDNPGNRAIHAERERVAIDALIRAGTWPLEQRRVLEVGCGKGDVIARLAEWGVPSSRLCGVDILSERLGHARRRLPDADLVCAAADRLPILDHVYDVVVAFTLFSSILDPALRVAAAQEVARVLQPGGILLWYDMRYANPRNPQVTEVTKRELRALFPGFEIDLQPTTLLPPLARRLGRLTGPLYPVLRLLPALRSHLVGTLAKPGANAR